MPYYENEYRRLYIMNVNYSKVLKVAGKYAMPVLSGILTISTELENQKLRGTVKWLTKEVTELKTKIK